MNKRSHRETRYDNQELTKENARLKEQLRLANETIMKGEHVVGWLAAILSTRSHRSVSYVRRLLRMNPEMPVGALESVKKSIKSSAEHSK